MPLASVCNTALAYRLLEKKSANLQGWKCQKEKSMSGWQLSSNMQLIIRMAVIPTHVQFTKSRIAILIVLHIAIAMPFDGPCILLNQQLAYLCSILNYSESVYAEQRTYATSSNDPHFF